MVLTIGVYENALNEQPNGGNRIFQQFKLIKYCKLDRSWKTYQALKNKGIKISCYQTYCICFEILHFGAIQL